MPSGLRLQRIADRIREELSAMLIREISDPRLKLIYVTDVKIDKELAYADVFVSAVEGVSRSKDVLAGLESASGFIKRTLASRIELRAFPRVRYAATLMPVSKVRSWPTPEVCPSRSSDCSARRPDVGCPPPG